MLLLSVMAKHQYKIRNWGVYNKALKERGNLGIWLDQETIEAWELKRIVGKNGRPKKYSDKAIECILSIRLLFNLPLRATEGLLRSLFKGMKKDVSVPDYTLVCKRQKSLKLPSLCAKKASKKPISDVVIDSTGVKVYGEGEWKVKKHGQAKRRKWCKLHIVIDAETGEIIAETMTDNGVGDSEKLPELLEEIENKLGKVLADGAYDTRKCYDKIRQCQGEAIIPPRQNGCLWPEEGLDHARNKALFKIESEGLSAWKKEMGYHKRSLIESTMHRLKKSFTGRLKAKHLKNQGLECRLICRILNQLVSLGMPDAYVLE